MKAVRKLGTTRVVAGLALASGLLGTGSLVLGSGGTAVADPAYSTGNSFVGVGSDTTQDLFAAFTGASPAPGSGVATTFFTPLNSGSPDYDTVSSFDGYPLGGSTVAPGAITTKPGGDSFDRPDGSSAGINALLAAIGDQTTAYSGYENSPGDATGGPENVTGQLDFARSARTFKTSGTELTFIPYNRDGLSVMYAVGSGTSSPITSFTTSELTNLYAASSGGSVAASGSTPAYTYTGTGEETISGVSVYASDLQSGAGQVATFNTTISDGYSGSTIPTAVSTQGWIPAGGANGITENSADDIQAVADGGNPTGKTLGANQEFVLPDSVGSVLGQLNGVGVDESISAIESGLVGFANITNSSGTDLGYPCDSGSTVGSCSYTPGTPLTPNTTYYQDPAWGYDNYVVVPTSELSGSGVNLPLRALFDTYNASHTAAICLPAALAEDAEFGFDALVNPTVEGTCGEHTITGNA